MVFFKVLEFLLGLVGLTGIALILIAIGIGAWGIWSSSEIVNHLDDANQK